MSKNELVELINARIEKLRPKLLDLTRRNPLISTKFSDKSHAYVRVVDELPQILFNKITDGSMTFISLPDLLEDPKDEKSREFLDALSQARITDEGYLSAIQAIDQNTEEASDRLAALDRELKDRLRESLGMPPRQTSKSPSLVQHAKNHDIDPSYDLIVPDESHSDGRHEDNNIQTLLLQDMLERRLTSIINKNDTWVDETGINVLKAAFGFLEWTESGASQANLAPLVLLPVEITKNKTREGFEFVITASGESPETNTVLMEKLKSEIGVELPVFNEEEKDLEKYFAQVSKLIPKGMTWRVRRQVAIGVFPSARMAMYHDLDTAEWSFSEHESIRNLLAGKSVDAMELPFGDDYQVDSSEIEVKVPLIVTDADASQFSVIVDVMDDKDVAVEGPPGTGKSQTIVNTIAVALSKGKKVLFIAEKTAALEVVGSRLEACGLGEFLLPLQATKSNKAKVIESVRKRIDISREQSPIGFEEKIAQFKKVRNQLAEYIDTISTQFGNTELTVHDILGGGIHAQEKLGKYLDVVGSITIPGSRMLSKATIGEILHYCNLLEVAWKKARTLQSHWQIIEKQNLDPYTADEILQSAKECADSCIDLHAKREELRSLQLSTSLENKDLSSLKGALDSIFALSDKVDVQLLDRMLKDGAFERVQDFFKRIEELDQLRTALLAVVVDPSAEEAIGLLERLIKAMDGLSIDGPSTDLAQQAVLKLEQKIAAYKDGNARLRNVLDRASFMEKLPAATIVALCDIKQGISKRLLAFRAKSLEAPDARDVLANGMQIAQDLINRKANFESKFLIPKDITNQQLTDNATTLFEAGLFCFLSPKFHKARKFYLSIARQSVFDRKNAALALRDIAHWRDEFQGFSENGALKQVLGEHFKGCETNFTLFVELLDFYDQVDSKLSGFENAVCRDFLKQGDLETVVNLPTFDTDDFLRGEKRNFEQLSENISAGERKLKDCREICDDLKKGISFLKKTDGVCRSDIDSCLDDLKTFQSLWKALDEDQDALRILGSYFEGATTDQRSVNDSLSVCMAFVKLKRELQEVALGVMSRGQVRDALRVFTEVLEKESLVERVLNRFVGLAGGSSEKILSGRDWMRVGQFLSEASADKEGLLAHSIVYSHKQDLKERGCAKAIDVLLNAQSDLQDFSDLMSALISRSLVREVYVDHGSTLSKYDGDKLNLLRARLAELDREIIVLSRKHLKVSLRRQAKPPAGIGEGKRSSWTQMALINNEIAKKQRYVPIRDLTKRAGKALLELKPCWMMSPLAVAQYISKGDIEFDLVIIDEASQMTPEDAIGGLARGRHVMVVGDTNQLPPTSFFKKIIDDADEDEDVNVLEESILEMANAAFRPARRLRWHYRSRHPSLIAFSNKYVYNDDLTIFPSPDGHQDSKGVSLCQVKGLYANGTNPIEASALVDGAVKFMRQHPDMSLGVVVLNQKQQELVSEQMEHAIAHDAKAQAYIEKWGSETHKKGLEKFFIKNLENVQGDERDVIFIGTVYGPEKEGAPVMQRFGPINGAAGKRRLNVLFTRAKHRIVTFSSMTANDIKADSASNEGVTLLKAWLEYCGSGTLTEWRVSGREPDSVFEEYVIVQLKAMGCEVTSQVGVAGYFIDIGVRHSDYPHGFIMGIECDGSTYHSSKSARDRDRLRQEVLEGLGWYLQRVWSTDWFNDPRREAERLRKLIQVRLDELRREPKGQPKEAPSVDQNLSIIENEIVGVLRKQSVLNADLPQIIVSIKANNGKSAYFMPEIFKAIAALKEKGIVEVYYQQGVAWIRVK